MITMRNSGLRLAELGAPLIGYSTWHDRQAEQEAKIHDFLGSLAVTWGHFQVRDTLVCSCSMLF